MIKSPVLMDSAFKLENVDVGKLVLLGEERKNSGTVHTVFLSRLPLTSEIVAEPQVQLNGYCAYSLLKNSDIIVGVVLFTPSNKTKIRSVALVVGTSECEQFTPCFNLENLGLLIFQATDSSTVFVNAKATSKMLVGVDQ